MKFRLCKPDEIDRVRFPITAAQHLSEGGRWVLHWNRMLYGFRVNVGPIEGLGYEIDYCCGDDPGALRAVTIIMRAALERIDESVSCGDLHAAFPRQRFKPMRNDPECWARLCELAGLGSAVAESLGAFLGEAEVIIHGD